MGRRRVRLLQILQEGKVKRDFELLAVKPVGIERGVSGRYELAGPAQPEVRCNTLFHDCYLLYR